jgi:hypothetical protein
MNGLPRCDQGDLAMHRNPAGRGRIAFVIPPPGVVTVATVGEDGLDRSPKGVRTAAPATRRSFHPPVCLCRLRDPAHPREA